MGILSPIIGFVALVSGLFAPASAMAALGFSFGGRIVSLPVPCINIPGTFLITIVPAGGDLNPFYVYTPGFSIAPGVVAALPPWHPGQEILGIADIVTGCNGVPTAQRIQYFGTSI